MAPVDPRCAGCGTHRADFATCGRCNARYCPCRADTHEGGHCRRSN